MKANTVFRYIYPLTFRTKMADLFGDPSCMHWWLPNDENYPPIVRSIRSFVEARTTQARDVPTEDLRDMKAIFASMKLDDGRNSHPESKETGYVTQPQIATTTSQTWEAGPSSYDSTINTGIGDGPLYDLGLDEGRGFWPEGQNQGAYGIPKQNEFQ